MLVEKIKELCAFQGITIKELERRAGLGNGTIRRWDDSSPALEKVIKVADYFGVSVETLLKEKQPFDIQAFAGKENAPAQIESERDKEILENCKDLSNDEMQKVFAYIEGLKANRK